MTITIQSVELLRRQTARLIRRELLSRRGRPIDLVALLRQRRPDGMPVWCLADPRYPLGLHNGAWDWPTGDRPASARCGGRRIHDIAKRKIAGLVAISWDWCWTDFLALEKWIQPGDDAPRALREYKPAETASV